MILTVHDKFDVVGEITFSKRLGFLEEGRDVDGIMASIWHWFEYVAVVSFSFTYNFWTSPTTDHNPDRPDALARLTVGQEHDCVSLTAGRVVAHGTVRQQMRGREARHVRFCFGEGEQPGQRQGLPIAVPGRPEKGPVHSAMARSSFFPLPFRNIIAYPQTTFLLTASSRALPAWTSSNIIAGSDTTAIFLRTMFHQLLTHPSSLAKLRAELDEAAALGNLSKTATWKESIALPYLNACFKEAGRIHPPFGLHLERVVPSGGLDVCGKTLPAGTIVGMNAWVVHRDPDMFGPDADAWRPERWLEGDEARVKKMDAALLTFGAGHRTCLGKHISYLEVFKLVPTLLQAYDIELIDEGKAWTVQNRWFVPQSGFHVKLRKRESTVANL